MAENIHKGHRLRLKQQFLDHGLSRLLPHQTLELALFYCVPQKDTNGLAHQLLKTFGTLYAVFDARYEDLLAVPGVTPHIATYLHMIGALFEEYYKDKYATDRRLTTTEALAAHILPQFVDKKQEALFLLCMDNQCQLRHAGFVNEGSVNALEISVRKILQQALKYNATLVVIAHNHPNGFALPSRQDVDATKALCKALAVADIHVLDHLIIAGNGVGENGGPGDFVSMRETPVLAPMFYQNWNGAPG